MHVDARIQCFVASRIDPLLHISHTKVTFVLPATVVVWQVVQFAIEVQFRVQVKKPTTVSLALMYGAFVRQSVHFTVLVELSKPHVLQPVGQTYAVLVEAAHVPDKLA